jgi:hypothetical protein
VEDVAARGIPVLIDIEATNINVSFVLFGVGSGPSSKGLEITEAWLLSKMKNKRICQNNINVCDGVVENGRENEANETKVLTLSS